MELYREVSYQLSRVLTDRYTSSFGLSSRLFSPTIRSDIYAIYGFVRIADEIVDTYGKNDSRQLLDDLEHEAYQAINRQYSTNPIVHSFAITADTYGINESLIAPFFKSMRMDIDNSYTQKDYQQYIYGSAEVIGLMCLKVFCQNDNALYNQLESGAQALGSAYQKVNFLRDIKHDYEMLGRVYFPGIEYKTFNENEKKVIESDIAKDFAAARLAINALPDSSRKAVATSYVYYTRLLQKITETSVHDLKQKRIRIPNAQKLALMQKVIMQKGKV